jgi:hypothetical protein
MRTHLLCSMLKRQRGLPRRVSSMPSTAVGSGTASSASAYSTNAPCAVGHVTPNASATSATDRHASPTAAPIARRNRPVVRAPAGTSSMASVNEPRPQLGSWQRHRVLRQRTEIPLSP